MNKFVLPVKTLSGTTGSNPSNNNSGLDLIDPENSFIGNLVVCAEGPSSKKMRCTTISPTVMSNNILSNTMDIAAHTSDIAWNTSTIVNVTTRTQHQNSSNGATTFLGDLSATGAITTNAGVTAASFRVPSGTASQLMLANGTVDTTALSSITTLQNSVKGSTVAIGVNSGNASQGAYCVAVGQSAGQTSQSDYGVAVGLSAGQNTQGIYSTAIGLNAGQNTQGQGCVAIGLNSGQTNQGDNSVAIGRYSGQTNQSTNSIVINASPIWSLDTTYQSQQGLFINPVRNDNSSSSKVVCYNSTSKELTYNTDTLTSNLIGDVTGNLTGSNVSVTNLDTVTVNGFPHLDTTSYVNYYLFFTSSAILTASSSYFPANSMISIGAVTTLVTQTATNTFTKIFRCNNPTSSVGDGQKSGYIGTSAFPKIWIGTGFVFNMAFAIGDTNTASGICQMFAGFTTTTTAPSFSSTLGPGSSSQLNIIGIGCDVGDSVISFYNKGPTLSGIASKIATTFSVATPSQLWFNLTFVNLAGSNDVRVILNGTTSAGLSTTVSQTFTAGIVNTTPIYPIAVRAMSTAGGVTGSAQMAFQKFSLYLK